MSQNEMHDRSPVHAHHEGTIVWRAPCPTCRNVDDSLNTEAMDEEGSCIFGCGASIDSTGICFHCGDHSANGFECETCGKQYEQWDGQWAYVVGTPR